MTALSQAQDFIAVEKLEIANMTKSARGTLDNPGQNVKQKTGLNRFMLEQNWGKFVQFLKYKMEELGHVLIEIDPRDTSRTCPVCGHVAKENRASQSEFVCRACGHRDNADHNASINILMRGYEAAGLLVSERMKEMQPEFHPLLNPAGI